MNQLKFVQTSELTGFANVAMLAAAVVFSSAAAASHQRSGFTDNSFYAYAKVTQAEPIYETFEHQVPREQCWNEKVRYDTYDRHTDHHPQHHARNRSSTPVILGALIGGALGNELGHHKRNKQVGAVAGAILGGAIGADIQRQNHRERHHNVNSHDNYHGNYDASYDVAYRTEQRCKTYYDIETEQRLSGYQVSYIYSGHEYHTITDQHPGKKLRVRIAVAPAE